MNKKIDGRRWDWDWVTFREKVMKNLRASLGRLIKAEAGVTAIEYGLIAALVGMVIVSSLVALGLDINTNFNHGMHSGKRRIAVWITRCNKGHKCAA